MTIGDRLLRLVTRPGEELSRLARFVQFQIQLWRFCAARLHTNNLPAMAAALSFRTIFALVPVLVLAFLAAGSLGAIEDSKQSLRAFLDASGFAQIGVADVGGVPPAAQTAPTSTSTRVNVADELIALVDRVEEQLTIQRLGPIGAALLIWTALSLLSTMEASLNRVFGATRSRSTVRRVLLYWSAMTLGPIVITLAVFLSRRAMLAASEVPLLAYFVGPLIWLGPMLVGVLVLTATYIMLPNIAVNRKAALGGATVAVLFWLIARWGFALYVERLVLPGNLYGILGVIPLFLLWLNLSWLIFLFGAELAHTAANIRHIRLPEQDEPAVITPDDAIAVALCVLRNYETGQGAASPAVIAGNVRATGVGVQWLVERLADRGVLSRVDGSEGPRYLPARPADRITVAQILTACDPADAVEMGGPRTSDGIPAIVGRLREQMQSEVRNLTLADLRLEAERLGAKTTTGRGGSPAPAARE